MNMISRQRVVRKSVMAPVGALVCALGVASWAVAATPPSKPGVVTEPGVWKPNPDLSAAPAGLYKLDPKHAHIRFTAQHYGGISYPMLTFRAMESEYQWDPKHPEATIVETRIRTSRLESGDRDFDVRMNSPGYLFPDGWKPPESFSSNPTDPRRIIFVTTSIKFTGKNTGTMTGDLTFYGQMHPITLNFTYNGSLNSAEPGIQFVGHQKMGFSAQGSFKRSDFGMTNLPTVGDEVKFWLELEYHLTAPGAATSFAPFP